MEKISVSDMELLIREREEIAFKKEIEELQTGEALMLMKSEWKKKANPWSYYRSKKMNNVKVIKSGSLYFILKMA